MTARDRDSDTCSAAGAERLASQIRQFWANKGFASVKVWTERSIRRAGDKADGDVFGVRSDLRNGRPET